MKRHWTSGILTLVLLLIGLTGWAGRADAQSAWGGGLGQALAGGHGESGPVSVRAVASEEPIARGSTARIGVEFVVSPGFHIQSASPHDPFLIPTSMKLQPPAGVTVGAVAYPKAKEIPAPPGSSTPTLSVYDGAAYAVVPITVSADAPLGKGELTLKITTQACNDTNCLPPTTRNITVPLTIAEAGTKGQPKEASLFEAADKQGFEAATQPAPGAKGASSAGTPPAAAPGVAPGAAVNVPGGQRVKLMSVPDQVAAIQQRAYKPYNAAEHKHPVWAIVLFALIGGVILNIMPCVLPVIPLKVLSLVQQAHGDRRLAVLHAFAFSGGVIFLFMVLALALKGFGLFYGQQFQSVGFLIAMVLFVVALALSMVGVWTINPPAAVYSVEGSQGGYGGAFVNGLMATLLATPCSAPYLGAVLAWALVQPAWVTALALGLVGVGMSLPYLILAAFPAALEKLPRAGRWSELLKQGLGIVMIGVAVYLVTLIPDVTLWPWVLLGCVVLGLVCWGWGQIPTASMEVGRVWAIRAAVVVVGLLMGAGVYAAGRMMSGRAPAVASEESAVLPAKGTTGWQPFNVALLDAALKEGRPVVVDWTADWCINCRTLEALVLSRDGVESAFRNHDAVLLRADLSRDNPPAKALNEKLGGEAIPALAIFSPSRPLEPVVLRDSYTQGRVIETVANAQ